LRQDVEWARVLGYLVLVGVVLFVALHAVSDIGITGLLGAKLASVGYEHDHGLTYTLYLTTVALDSVADMFGSLAAVAVGLLVMKGACCRAGLGLRRGDGVGNDQLARTG
jgi:hypothetical protein